MKIAINATIFNYNHSGAKRRFIGIYQEVFNNNPNYSFIVYDPIDCETKSFFNLKYNNVLFKKTKLKSYSTLQRFIFGFFYWKKELKKIKPDIFETFSLPLIQSPVGKTVLTIHDIRYLKFPQFYSKFRVLIAKKIVKEAAIKADILLVVSETIKDELAEYTNKAKIKVIYNPSDTMLSKAYKEKKIIKNSDITLGFSGKYILSVGIIEKRKNYINLIQSVSLLHSIGYDFKLVIVGNRSDDFQNVINLIDNKKLNNKIILYRNISDHNLKYLYKNSEGFIFQSIYEGFGIPIIEALKLEVPMVLSNLKIFKEITENKSFYFNPINIDSISNAIIELLEKNKKLVLDKIEKNNILKKFDKSKLSNKLTDIYLTTKNL